MPHEYLALPYVLGALSLIEREAVERARLYDRALDRAIADLELRIAGALPDRCNASPPDELWRGIRAALAAEYAALAGKCVETFPDGGWLPLSPGIDTKRLGQEDAWLLRCDAGPVAWPSVTDRGRDNALIVAGDLCLGPRCFSTGDYLSGLTGGLPASMHSRNGCILLLLGR